MRHHPPLKHLNRHQGRHGNGKVYWYVRVAHGPRIPLPGAYGSPEFMAAYAAAIQGKPVQRPPRAGKGTLRWLVETWKGSSNWNQTTPATRKQRDHFLGQMLEAAGEAHVEDITREVVLAGREHRQATPAAANNYLKTARALFRWAKEAGLVAIDPARDVPFLKVKTKGFPAWTMDEVEAFRRRWPLGTSARLALEIFINTGIRLGDAAILGRQHLREGVIHMRAGKTGTELYIPLLPALKAAIEAGPVGEAAFLVTRYGRPWAKESLGNEFREWCRAAGIGKSAHGVRKLVSTALADAGGSEQELQALMGWTTNTMSLVYTRERDRKRQALQAAFKLLEELEKNAQPLEILLPNP